MCQRYFADVCSRLHTILLFSCIELKIECKVFKVFNHLLRNVNFIPTAVGNVNKVTNKGSQVSHWANLVN